MKHLRLVVDPENPQKFINPTNAKAFTSNFQVMTLVSKDIVAILNLSIKKQIVDN